MENNIKLLKMYVFRVGSNRIIIIYLYIIVVLKPHKLQVANDKISQLSQITSQIQNDDSSNGITFKIDCSSSSKAKSKSNLNVTNRLNYYKFDYYDYLCTILGIVSLLINFK